jgi:hypothetical protein
MTLARKIARNGGFLAAIVIAAWVGTEMGGKGTGLIRWLFVPEPTKDGDFHPVDWVGLRPKGPVRLTPVEAQAAEARIAAAFEGRKLPAYRRTSEMSQYLARPSGALEPMLGALLSAMHPATEHVLWLMVKSLNSNLARGETVLVAVFAGADGRLKILFDLRKVAGIGAFPAFTLKRFDRLEAYPAKIVGEGLVMVDDPGPLRSPGGIAAAILLYGGTNPPDNNIVGVISQGDFAERQRFFAAVLGLPFNEAEADVPHAARAAAPPPAPAAAPKEQEGDAAAVARESEARAAALKRFVECDNEVERLYPLGKIAELYKSKQYEEGDKMDGARDRAKAKCDVEHARNSR